MATGIRIVVQDEGPERVQVYEILLSRVPVPGEFIMVKQGVLEVSQVVHYTEPHFGYPKALAGLVCKRVARFTKTSTIWNRGATSG